MDGFLIALFELLVLSFLSISFSGDLVLDSDNCLVSIHSLVWTVWTGWTSNSLDLFTIVFWIMWIFDDSEMSGLAYGILSFFWD